MAQFSFFFFLGKFIKRHPSPSDALLCPNALDLALWFSSVQLGVAVVWIGRKALFNFNFNFHPFH